ncbi:MAG: hypothetical protein HQL22_00355 [Candidatus Omnitrophica bacterium]|nr:hypothetical protein [Candidatus Omnitrophota bacterium]
MNIFRQPLMAVVMSLLLVSAFSGCIYLAVGAVGVVGGYVVSPDTVEGTSSHSLEECWDSTKQIVGIMGKIVQESPNGSQLDAMINGANVTVTLSSVNVSVTKISVKARKVFMPKIDIAQDVYTKIINSMEK